MDKRTIVFSYRKIMDHGHKGPWERLVIEQAYQEFRMQAQFYNRKNNDTSYAELLRTVPEAEKLPYLVSGAILGYLTQLNERIPDIINNQGKTFLTFKKFSFEIITAHTQQKTPFKIAINFFSEPLTWLETIGNYMLVGEAGWNEYPMHTNLVAIQPYLSIHAIDYIDYKEGKNG